jgi:hypothetical protein
MQIILMFVFSAAFNAYADSWNCSSSDLVREVIIDYATGNSLPCDVVYKKQTEGFEDQVLWSAENDEAYCEEKARELVANLESWGWVCMETVSSETGADASSETGPDTSYETGPDTEQAADQEQAKDM